MENSNEFKIKEIYNNKIIICTKESIINKLSNLDNPCEGADKDRLEGIISMMKKYYMDSHSVQELNWYLNNYNKTNIFENYIPAFNTDNDDVVFIEKSFVLKHFEKDKYLIDNILHSSAIKFNKHLMKDTNKEILKFDIKILYNSFPILKDYLEYTENEDINDFIEEDYSEFFQNNIQNEILDLIVKKSKNKLNSEYTYLSTIDYILDTLIRKNQIKYDLIETEVYKILYENTNEFKFSKLKKEFKILKDESNDINFGF